MWCRLSPFPGFTSPQKNLNCSIHTGSMTGGVTYSPQGEGVRSATYAQQQAPVTEQKEAVGHAVRATYLYAGMADVGQLTHNPAYAQALDRIWGNIVNTRMHITGGLGAIHGIEGFGPQYLLPNDDAFNETCAAVGNVLFNYRMFLLNKDAKYLDVAEVALLNNVLAAVNLEGNRFFYVNPLGADGKYPFNHGTGGRAPWFGTACCPSNMARLLPQVQGMTYAHDDKDLYVTFYAETATTAKIAGTEVGIQQKTAYPNEGAIEISLSPKKPTDFRLFLRIPTWAGKQFVPGELYHYLEPVKEPWKLFLNGKPVEAKFERGFAVLERQWKKGDQVKLVLSMEVKTSRCHDNVEDNRGRLALTRGPFVLCAEGLDNGGATQRFFLGDQADVAKAKVKKTTIPSGSFIQVSMPAQAITKDGGEESRELTLTPYYAWNNRGNARMDKRDFDGAIEDCSRAIEIDPEYVRAWNNRGIAQLRKNNRNEALKDFTRTIELDPNNPRICNNLGLVYGRLGNADEALATFRRVGSEEAAQHNLTVVMAGYEEESQSVDEPKGKKVSWEESLKKLYAEHPIETSRVPKATKLR